MAKIVNITQADLGKLPATIRDNPELMALVTTIVTTYTKLEKLLGYDLVLAAEPESEAAPAPGPAPEAEPAAAPAPDSGAKELGVVGIGIAAGRVFVLCYPLPFVPDMSRSRFCALDGTVLCDGTSSWVVTNGVLELKTEGPLGVDLPPQFRLLLEEHYDLGGRAMTGVLTKP